MYFQKIPNLYEGEFIKNEAKQKSPPDPYEKPGGYDLQTI